MQLHLGYKLSVASITTRNAITVERHEECLYLPTLSSVNYIGAVIFHHLRRSQLIFQASIFDAQILHDAISSHASEHSECRIERSVHCVVC